MICPFCTHEFDREKARAACGGSCMVSDCRMVRCPRCGYECPQEPAWAERLRRWFGGQGPAVPEGPPFSSPEGGGGQGPAVPEGPPFSSPEGGGGKKTPEKD